MATCHIILNSSKQHLKSLYSSLIEQWLIVCLSSYNYKIIEAMDMIMYCYTQSLSVTLYEKGQSVDLHGY